MSKVICYGEFDDLELGRREGEILIVRAFNAAGGNAHTADNRTDGMVLHAFNWHEFSVRFHEEAIRGLNGSYTPQITYNFLGGRDLAYNEVINLLTSQFCLEELGISEAQGNSQKIGAIDEFIRKHRDNNFIDPGLFHEIDKVLNNEMVNNQYIFKYQNFGPICRTQSLSELVDLQLKNTGKELPENIIVLVGDAQVKHFLSTKGKELLAQVALTSEDKKTLAQYRRQLYQAVADKATKHFRVFPNSVAALTKGQERG